MKYVKTFENFKQTPIVESTISDEYSVDKLIGKKMKYGSPGYPMIFFPREITETKKGVFEFVGDIPSLKDNAEGHFFKLTQDQIIDLFNDGEVHWMENGGYSELSMHLD